MYICTCTCVGLQKSTSFKFTYMPVSGCMIQHRLHMSPGFVYIKYCHIFETWLFHHLESTDEKSITKKGDINCHLVT